MEGWSGRSAPPLVRSFVPSRLAEDLMAGVYERLLGTRRQRDPLPETDRSRKVGVGLKESMEQESPEVVAIGGRS
jgi:hypothetical protein